MHLIAVVLVLYIIYAEWRAIDLRKKLQNCQILLDKLNEEKTVWYSGVLDSQGAGISSFWIMVSKTFSGIWRFLIWLRASSSL